MCYSPSLELLLVIYDNHYIMHYFNQTLPLLDLSVYSCVRSFLYYFIVAKTVLPLSAGTPLNTITTPSGVKMIVVSSAGLTSGQQTITLMTTSANSGKLF